MLMNANQLIIVNQQDVLRSLVLYNPIESPNFSKVFTILFFSVVSK